MARAFVAESNQYLQVDTAPLQPYPVTMAAWFYPVDDTTLDDQNILWLGDKDVPDDHFLLRWDATSINEVVARDRDSVGEDTAIGAVINPSTGWHHLAAVFPSNSTRSVWVDGSETVQNGTRSNRTTFDRFAIGAARDSTPGDWNDGYIAEAGLWNVALSQAEINMLNAGARPLSVRPQNLVVYCPLVRDDVDLMGAVSLSAVGSPTYTDHVPVFYSIPQQYSGAQAVGVSPSVTTILRGGFRRPEGLIVGTA